MAKKKELPDVEGATPPAETSAGTNEPQLEETKSKSTGKQKGKNQNLQSQLAAAEEQVTRMEGELQSAKDSLLRTAAEYENYRKRSQKETDSAFGNGVSCAACELLPVIDTLEVAAMAPTTDEEYKKGVVLTLQKCSEVFKKLGIYEIEALGQPFDPELHNAVMQEEAEGAESGTVTKVMQKGYKLNEKVIRHAMVAVAP